MYYVLYKMGNSKSETESMKIKKLKMIVMYMYRCKPACAPLFSCTHSIVKLRAMVIHVRVYARRLTIHINFTQAQACRNYRYMPRSWPECIDRESCDTLVKGHPKEFHVIVDHERVPQNSSNLFVHDLQKLVFSSAKIIPEITRFCCPKDA